MPPMLRRLVTGVGFLGVLLVAGCSTMNGARPLADGEQAMGLTVGGPVVFVGDSPIPLPNANLEGRTGLAPLGGMPFDTNYGLNLMGLPFGVLQGHVGASLLLMEEADGVPALSVTDRLYLGTNLPGLATHTDARPSFWASNQLELDASWLFGGQLAYVGLAGYLDLVRPTFSLAPVVGMHFDFSPGTVGGFGLQLEGRWFAANRKPELDAVKWAGLGTGAIGVTLGVTYTLEGE